MTERRRAGQPGMYARTLETVVAEAKKRMELAGNIDPDDPEYHYIFDGLPDDESKSAVVNAIKDIAALTGYSESKQFGKEILQIAKEHGLVARNAKYVKSELFNLLLSKGHALSDRIGSQMFERGSAGIGVTRQRRV